MFETFDLKSFGIYIRDLRKSLSYTQKDIEDISGVSVDSQRRIERGTVLPRYDTLVYLSLAYKVDLLEDLKNYRNSNVIFQYYSRLDDLILKFDLNALQNLVNDFNEFSGAEEEGTFINNSVKEQFLLILEGISALNSENFSESLNCFIEAIRVSIPTFEPEKFSSQKYTHFETRILTLIAFSLRQEKQLKLSSKILKECLSRSNFDIEASSNEKLMICKLYSQLSYNYTMGDDFDTVIKYSQEGIEYCNKHHLSYGLAVLLYRRGIAEFKLGLDDYRSTLRKSINLLLITGKRELAERYAETTKEIYDIELHIDKI